MAQRQKKQQKRIAKTEVAKNLQQAQLGNDVIRLEGMQNLRVLKAKKAKFKGQELKRLVEKHGQNHALTQQVENDLDQNGKAVASLTMEINRASTEVKKVPENAWALQGRVYDVNGVPVIGAKVELYSQDEIKIEQVESVTTNQRGYYFISYDGRQGNPEKEKDSTSDIQTNDEAAANLSEAQPTAGLRINTNQAESQAAEKQGMTRRLRINTQELKVIQVFARASDPKDSENCADSTLVIPRVGSCHYRDIVLDMDQGQSYVCTPAGRRQGRFLGNSATRELHDLNNEKGQCQVDSIRVDHCYTFSTEAEAVAMGYDYCAFCFSRERSKR